MVNQTYRPDLLPRNPLCLTPRSPPLPRDLHYVDDTQPGIRRKHVRGKFQYFNAKAERITDKDEIKRLNALAVPPAYTDVWICADPRGHLQATGRDARGRKQYRYHPRWREVRDTDEYSRLQAFGSALPKLRKQLEAQLAEPGCPRKSAGHGCDAAGRHLDPSRQYPVRTRQQVLRFDHAA